MNGPAAAARLIDLATSLEIPVMAVDAETLGIIGASDPALRILGLERRDIGEVPASWLSFLDGATLSEVRSFSREARDDSRSRLRFAATGTFRDSLRIRMTFLRAPDFLPEGTLAVGFDPDSACQSADRDSERLAEREIETSARIQRTLLAGSYTFAAPGVSLSAETIPSLKVDGDFYDFFELGKGRVDFLIGDVMGKGVPAALTAAALKAAVAKAIIREVVAHGEDVDPVRVLAEADRAISPGLIEMGRFLTLYYCRLSVSEGILRFIDAGHTSFLYYDSRRQRCWQAKGSNMPVGFADGQLFRSYALPFHKDDLFLFYSDGITEAESADGSLFSTARLMQLLAAHGDLPPEELVKKTLSLVFFFSSGGFRDDATLLAAKITGDTPEPARRYESGIDRGDENLLAGVRERFVSDLAAAWPGEDDSVSTEFSVAILESLGNVIRHTEGEARIDWEINPRRITVGLEFEGKEYDWFERKEPVIEDYPEHGFGSWLISRSTESVLVLRGKDDANRIVITRGRA